VKTPLWIGIGVIFGVFNFRCVIIGETVNGPRMVGGPRDRRPLLVRHTTKHSSISPVEIKAISDIPTTE
jgi:hypothetical protein